MKKIFYSILAAAAIVASCAKEPISEPVSPSGDGSSVFTGTIIQPGGIDDATKVSIIAQTSEVDKVYIKWTSGDQIHIIKKGSGEEWNSTTESNKPKVFSAASSEATTDFSGFPPNGWIASGATYAARYYGNNDVWKNYVLACDAVTPGDPVNGITINCNGNAEAAFLENMPLSCGESVYDSGNTRYNFTFSNAYAILQINVPSKLDFKDLYVCVNAQNVEFESGQLKGGSKYTLCLKDADAVKSTDKYTNKDRVTYFVPVSAYKYDKLTIVAAKGNAEVARMETYAGNVKNGSDSQYALPQLNSNNIYPFDFCNTKTIDAAGTYSLESNNGIDYRVNIAADITSDVTINAEVDSKEPANIYINNRGHQITGKLTINASKSHVEGENGFATEVEAHTSNSTFVVKSTLTITGLTVKKGSVKVEGNENKTANVETITIPADAEGFINIDVTGVTAGDKKVVIDNQSANGTVQLVKATDSKYEIKEGSKPVSEIEGDVAKIGDKKYFSLAEAIAAVQDGETITLLKNVDQAFGISVPKGSKTFTVDFGGFTYKVEKPGAGSANTKTQAFQLNEGNTITFTNGRIECTAANKDFIWTSDSKIKGVAMIIQNYANLTLENMTIDATNIAHNGAASRYAISNNSGNVEFKGATSIISADGDYAFDAYKYDTYTKPVVKWNSTGTVNGVIELSGGDFIVAKDLKVSRPIRSNSNPSTLTVNSGVTVSPAEKFPKVNTSFANDFNEATSGVVIVNRGGNLTINGEGTITSTVDAHCYAAVSMTETGEAAEGDKAKLTIDGNVTLEGLYYGVVGNGQRHDTEITVKGGTVKGLAANDNAGIYHPQKGILTINGGTIEGATGIYVKSGDFTASINAGTIKGVGTKATYNPDREGDGFIPTGDAVVFDNCGYPGGAPNADIKGGTFTSTNANAIESYAKTGFDPITGFISGGTFNTQPDGKLIADGYKIKEVSDTEYTVSAIDPTKDVVILNAFAYETLAAAVEVAETGDVISIVKAGTYTVPGLSKNVTIVGKEGVEFNCDGPKETSIASIPNGATFKNVTLNMGQTDYHGFHHAGYIQFKNCTINGFYKTYGNTKFEDCVFNQDEYAYCLNAYGDDLDVVNCTFNNKGKAFYCYNEGTPHYTVNFTGCTFIATGVTTKCKAAIFVKHNYQNQKYTVKINDCTASFNAYKPDDDDLTGTSLWNVEVAPCTGADVKVYVNDVLKYDNTFFGIGSVKALVNFANAVNAGKTFEGKTITLDADLDLTGVDWKLANTMESYPSIGFFGTFDGKNHTISNLTSNANAQNHACAGFIGAGHCTIKDLTLKNVNVTSTHYAGAFVGYASASVNLYNCKLEGGSVTSTPELIGDKYDNGDKAGGLVGYAIDNGVIDNCVVDGVTVKAYRDLGGVAGAYEGTIKNCTVKNSTIIQDNTNGYQTYVTTYGAILGRDLGATLQNNTATENVEVKSVN